MEGANEASTFLELFLLHTFALFHQTKEERFFFQAGRDLNLLDSFLSLLCRSKMDDQSESAGEKRKRSKLL